MKPNELKIYKFFYVLFKEWWFYGYWRQALYLAKYKISNPNGLKIILVYCSGRTGSTVFCSTLGDVKGLWYGDEILRKKLIHYPSFVLGHAKAHKNSWCIIKVKPMHLQRLGISLTELIKNLGSQELHKVHLLRKNHFDHAVSAIIAKKRRFYNSKTELLKSMPKVEIPFSFLKTEIDKLKNGAKKEASEIEEQNFTEYTYEQHIFNEMDFLTTQDSVLKSIGINGSPKKPSYKKVLSTDLSTEIENWTEIESLREY